MAKQLKVLMVSAEAVPFAKVGGLADVVGALPKALERAGVDVRIILPKYETIDESKHSLKACGSPFPVPISDHHEPAEVFETQLPGSKVKVLLVRNDKYFGRPGIYNDPDTGEGYPDNAERFTFFSRAVVELVKSSDWQPQVIHCNDYQTALIPAFLQVLYRNESFADRIATLFSIHNLAYQGIFPQEILAVAGFDRALYYPVSDFEFWGNVNFMKIGITKADIITTVSETYAQEISSDPEFGCGLEGILKDREKSVFGILNGIDYSVWNPEIDQLIPSRYNQSDLTGKRVNKKALLKKVGLPDAEKAPVIGIISRLVDQKGFDLLEQVINEVMSLDLKLVLLGTGQQKYHDLFNEIAKVYPEKISVNLTFDNQLAHLIEAGSDMFLMPSRYEPCGLNQMYSLKYGAVPIVRATGGLADTIKDYDAASGRGNGFVFVDYSPTALLDTIRRAVDSYRDRIAWSKLVARGMSADFSWEKSAAKYVELYQQAKRKRRVTA